MTDQPTTDSGRPGEESARTHPVVAPTAPPIEPPTPLTQQVGRVVVGVLALLFLVFALANSQPVTFNWIFDRTDAVETPAGIEGGVRLIYLLLGAFALGLAVGIAALWRTQRVRRARLRRGEIDTTS